MIETKQERAARDKTEARARDERAKSYAASMGIALPDANVNTKAPETANVNTNKDANVNKKGDRNGYMKEYMKEYRARPKKCPHCGGEL